MSPQLRSGGKIRKSTQTRKVTEPDTRAPVARILTALDVPPQADLIFRNVLPPDCQKVYDKVQLLKSQGNRTPCEYYSNQKILVIKAMPGPVHECVQDWFQHVINEMQQAGFIHWRDWLKFISRNVGMDFKDFRGPHRGSWKQPDFAIRSLYLSIPNLVIETAFTQGEENLCRKVQLWLEGSEGVMQLVIVVKMREGTISSQADRSASGTPNSDSSDDDTHIASVLSQEDNHLVGPIDITVELWRWRDGVYLDHQLNLPTVSAGDVDDVSGGVPLTFPLKITDVYGISQENLPPGRSSDEIYHVDTSTLVDFVRVFRLLLGRHRRLQRASG